MRVAEDLHDTLSANEIAFIQSAILGTSFGQSEGVHMRPYKPLGKVAQLLELADIGAASDGYDVYMKNGLEVREEYTGEENNTIDQNFLEGQKNFLNFFLQKVDEVREIFPQAFYEHVKFQGQDVMDQIDRNLQI